MLSWPIAKSPPKINQNRPIKVPSWTHLHLLMAAPKRAETRRALTKTRSLGKNKKKRRKILSLESSWSKRSLEKQSKKTARSSTRLDGTVIEISLHIFNFRSQSLISRFGRTQQLHKGAAAVASLLRLLLFVESPLSGGYLLAPSAIHR